MYLLITVVVAALVGLVLVALVQLTFGAPEVGESGRHGDSPDHTTPRFRITRRGYDIAEVEKCLASWEEQGRTGGAGQ